MERHRPIRCVIAGDGCVGKTSLAMKLHDRDFDIMSLEYTPTLYQPEGQPENGPLLTVTTDSGQEVEVQIVDTAEPEEWSRGLLMYYVQADVFLICYGVNKPHSLSDIEDRHAPACRHVSEGAPIIMVGTRCEYRTEDSWKSTEPSYHRELIPEQTVADVAGRVRPSRTVEVSVRDNVNIDLVLREAARCGLEFRNRPQTVPTKRRCVVL